jgi:glutamate---cysteine ligase / carboxylate-amine ligase
MNLARLLRPHAGALHAFAAFGLELEYMLVQRDSLAVAPIADTALERRAAHGSLGWSNELVAHVIELKNPRPTPNLAALAASLQAEVRAMNAALEPVGARLMPSAMHPWMDPRSETRLWPHDDAIYQAYHRIFDCRSHGWANLQSVHINLPFADDAEFAQLHAAVRLALPIIPAIAASSPFAGARPAGWLDYRLREYEGNARAVPQMNGEMVPEPMTSRAQYERELLGPLYAALAPYDPERLLHHEWVNARGAIARFDRNALEIRVVDVQECPAADVAISAAIIDLVRFLYRPDLPSMATGELARLLRACMRDAERAEIDSPAYLDALIGRSQPCTAAELWEALIARMPDAPHRTLWQPVLENILMRGPLARRLLRAVGESPSREELAALYAHLCECLQDGIFFDASSY